MSLRETWGMNFPEARKTHVTHYLHDLPVGMRKKVRDLVLELSLDAIDDPKVEEYRTAMRNDSALESLSFFINNSPYWWHVREWARFIVGHHRPIPDPNFNVFANFVGHFPHVSREDNKRIAIVMDMKKADADMHTTMKIGRYLSKYTEAPESVIPDISNIYANRNTTYKLETAKTPGEIQWVYENGPSSCMGKTIREAGFLSHVHPTHAYASPDLAVMFVRDLNDSNRVISRTVVSLIDNIYVRIFGNAPLMDALLQKQNIINHRTGSLKNHRLLKLTQEVKQSPTSKVRIQHIGPYLDCGKVGIYSKKGDDEYLYINPPKEDIKQYEMEYIGDTERSYSGKGFIDSPPLTTCAYCEGTFQEGNIMYYNTADINACSSCAQSHMQTVFDHDFSQITVPNDFEGLYTAVMIIGMHRVYTEDGLARRNEIEDSEYTFISEEEFLAVNAPLYRKTNIPIMPDAAIYIEKHDMYVVSGETIRLSYCSQRVLKEDTVTINGDTILREHLDSNHNFKFNTISGFPIPEVTENFNKYYFKVRRNQLENTSATRFTIIAVTDKPTPGFMSFNDFLMFRIGARWGFADYYKNPLRDIMDSWYAFNLLPDNSEELFGKDQSTGRLDSAYNRFFSSGITVDYQINIQYTEIVSPLRAIRDTRPDHKPKKRVRKKNIIYDDMQVVDLDSGHQVNFDPAESISDRYPGFTTVAEEMIRADLSALEVRVGQAVQASANTATTSTTASTQARDARGRWIATNQT